jgi:hypothetical protein
VDVRLNRIDCLKNDEFGIILSYITKSEIINESECLFFEMSLAEPPPSLVGHSRKVRSRPF